MMTNTDILLDTAFDAYNDNRLPEAESLAREVLMIQPTHGDALYLLGLIALRSDALSPAAGLLYQAVNLYPDFENYRLALASTLHRMERLDEALTFYEPLRNQPQVLAQIGWIYLEKGQKDDARTCFDTLVNNQEKIGTAYMGLAVLETDLENKERLLRQGLVVEKSPDLIYMLAQLLYNQQRYDEAKKIINQAPPNAAQMTLHGSIVDALGDTTMAMDLFTKATEKDPYNADAWVGLGNLLQKQGELEQASYAYHRALDVNKNHLNAHHHLANVLHKQGRTPQALEHYRDIITQHPTHEPTLYNLAAILETIEEWEEALGLYFNLLIMKADIQDLETRIHDSLIALANKDQQGKKHAKRFLKGWLKHFPDSQTAQSISI